MSPRVTVSIPTYNRAQFLRESISSVLNQTYEDFELLIADNASTDNTSEVVASFNDPRIRYHRHPSNLGMMLNYKFALTTPETEFVAYLSDDDLYLPEHLEVAIKKLDDFPEAAFFACPATFFGHYTEGELRPKAITDRQTPFLYFTPKQAVNFLGADNPGPMTVCRRKVLQHQIFWPKLDYLPIDLLVLTQLMIRGGFLFSNHSLVKYRVHEENTSVLTHKLKRQRFNCMVWFGVRWLAQFLIDQQICTLADIEAHGMQATAYPHVVSLILGLGSFDSPPQLRAIAKRVFKARTDMDTFSTRLRLARQIGFWTIPVAERLTQLRVGWHA